MAQARRRRAETTFDTSESGLSTSELSRAASETRELLHTENPIRQLIVGREISLFGEITSCEKLVIEGSIEGKLADCRTILISNGGRFKGSALTEDAVIQGRFEGNLFVRRRLLIKSGGQVIG